MLFCTVFIVRSVRFGKAWQMQSAWFALALILPVCTPALGAVRAHEHAHERVCTTTLTAAQAREMIALHRLAEPFRLMKSTAHHFQAEAIGVKLCRRKDEFIYVVSLLRRDGRVIHVFLNALSGKIVRAVNAK